MRIEVTTNECGRRVVVKHAESVEEAARLRREADVLEVATHPGLVELVGFEDGAGPVLYTGQIDGPSLEEGGALEVAEVAGVVAAVACILADLHGMGLVHGGLAPAHVLIDGDGRPVLCGLGYGGLAGEAVLQAPALAAEFVDAARAGAAVLDPASDVYGAGALILFLLERANGRASGAGAEPLRSVARRATADDVATRPTARQLADAAHDAVTSPCLPRRGAPAATFVGRSDSFGATGHRPLEGWRRALAPPPKRYRLRTVAPVVVAVVGVAGALAVFAWAPSGASPARVTAAPATTTAIATTIAAASATTAPTSTTPPVTARARAGGGGPAGCPTADGPLAADVNGDGCPETLRFADGVVTAGGLRWSVGEPGDIIAVGDWACSGARSLAVLRPRTGEVFAFPGWATPGGSVDAPLVGTVAGGRALRAADLDGDGCNELVVERATGAPVVLRAPRARP